MMFPFWGLQGCFPPPKTLVRAFGLATLGSLLLVLQAGGAGVGFLGTEFLHSEWEHT